MIRTEKPGRDFGLTWRARFRLVGATPSLPPKMKRLLPSTLLALNLLLLPSLSAAETKSAPPSAGKSSAKPTIAGEYSGNYKGSNETTGALRIKIKADGADWIAESMFTFEGTEVPTKMKSIKVEGSKVEIVFGWEVQGTAAQSKLNGEWDGTKIEGKYESSSAEGAAQGTWSVTRA